MAQERNLVLCIQFSVCSGFPNFVCTVGFGAKTNGLPEEESIVASSSLVSALCQYPIDIDLELCEHLVYVDRIFVVFLSSPSRDVIKLS